jgi:acyl-CoA dehydrogenase
MGIYKDWPLDVLVRPPAVTAVESARAYWAAHRAEGEGLSTFDAAVVGGVHADRLGWAFVAGYGAAVRALDPALPPGVMAALCATEARGVHPKDIETAARREGAEWVVDGVKVFATLAAEADVLLVVASAGPGEDERNRLVVVRVPVEASGVTREASPRVIPFAPEISHQVVRLVGVRVPESAALPGDGYEDALKPFRSIEDLHVFAAGLSYLCGVAGRFDWPKSFRERAVAVVMALRALASSPSGLRTPESHVALGGALALGREVVDASDSLWERAEATERERWRRDRPLMEVAGKARAARLEAAWRRLTSAPG